MKVGGLTRCTTIDYPGQLALVVFTQGCAWHCGYCYNRHLIPLERDNLTSWSTVLSILSKRQNLLDAVVFSGGEPLLQNDLDDAMAQVKDLGYLVGLHTSGARPQKLTNLFNRCLVDWVGLDIKAPWHKYQCITGVPDSGRRAKRSARKVIASGIDYELRTVIDPCHRQQIDIDRIKSDLRELGADLSKYVVRTAKGRNCDGAV